MVTKIYTGDYVGDTYQHAIFLIQIDSVVLFLRMCDFASLGTREGKQEK